MYQIKNTISEINNTLGGINRRLDEAEGRTSVLEDKVEKTPRQSRKKKKGFFFAAFFTVVKT